MNKPEQEEFLKKNIMKVEDLMMKVKRKQITILI